MKALLLFFSLVLYTNSFSQIGINGQFVFTEIINDGQYIYSRDETWSYSGNGTSGSIRELYDRGWVIGFDYRLRSRNYHIEFQPELSINHRDRNDGTVIQNTSTLINLFFKTNLYFLDIYDDCNCPTSSNKSPFLKKGLFFQIAPGISFWDLKYDGYHNIVHINRTSVPLSIGGALGLDMGINNHLTISPILGVRYFPKVRFKGHTGLPGQPSLDKIITMRGDPLFFSAGLRIGWE